MAKGSQWLKWDLHIHTPDSFENHFTFNDDEDKVKFSGKIWEKYIYELERIEEISVIGITDYFTIDGYKKVLEYRKEGKLKNFDLILPNIELRLEILSGKENRRLNFHIIFSNDINPNDIEEHFLHSLEFPTGKNENKRLTRKNIEGIGRILKEENSSFRGSDFEVGCKNISVNLDSILETLKKSKSIFDGKFLLILSASEWDDIGWDGQGHIIKKHSLFRSHAVFSSNPKTIAFCLGKTHPSVENFEKEFGQIKPCIHGSDAHSFDKLCKPDDDRYCWIKALPTFDGLRQIIFEPEGRIQIQKNNPESYKNIYSLNSVEFSDSKINNEISLVPHKIHFNKNFVAITGGKGSGKTAILDLIANCYMDRCHRYKDGEKNEEDKNSFVQRIQEDGEKLGITIDFIDESIEPFSKKLKELSYIEKTPITYLPQGKIEEISGDKIKLTDKIEETIFNNETVKESNFKKRFIQIKEKTDIYSSSLFDLNSKISKFESVTTNEIINKLNHEKQIADGKLTDIKNQIQRIEENLEAGIQEKISGLKKDIKRIKSDKTANLGISDEINLLKGGIENFVVSSNKTIESINKKTQDIDVKYQIPEINFESQVTVLDLIKSSLSDRNEKLTIELLQKEKALLELSGEEKIHSKLIKDTELIEIEIKNTTVKLEDLHTKKDAISQLEIERIAEYEKLLTAFLDWKNYYEEVIAVFSSGKNNILGDIDFKANIFFDYEKFFTMADGLINKRKISQEEIRIRTTKIKDALSVFFKGDASFNVVNDALSLFTSEKNIVKKSWSSRNYYDWLFGNYFSLITEVDFKGTSIDKLSMGQKGTVLLKLFLAEGDYPIILDQPEENLDNKFIYNELVGAMRNAKNNRQVIIATNNANLVVNTDAEQIIIAEFKDGKITYKSGALESLEIRQEIMPLLEGGPEAFKKREQKYGILGFQM